MSADADTGRALIRAFRSNTAAFLFVQVRSPSFMRNPRRYGQADQRNVWSGLPIRFEFQARSSNPAHQDLPTWPRDDGTTVTAFAIVTGIFNAVEVPSALAIAAIIFSTASVAASDIAIAKQRIIRLARIRDRVGFSDVKVRMASGPSASRVVCGLFNARNGFRRNDRIPPFVYMVTINEFVPDGLSGGVGRWRRPATRTSASRLLGANPYRQIALTEIAVFTRICRLFRSSSRSGLVDLGDVIYMGGRSEAPQHMHFHYISRSLVS